MVANAASISLKSFFFSAAGAQLVDNRIFSLATSATKRAVEFFCAPTLLWWSKFWIYSHRLSLIHGIFRCCDRLRLSKCATVATRSDHLSPNRFHSFNKKKKKREERHSSKRERERLLSIGSLGFSGQILSQPIRRCDLRGFKTAHCALRCGHWSQPEMKETTLDHNLIQRLVLQGHWGDLLLHLSNNSQLKDVGVLWIKSKWKR